MKRYILSIFLLLLISGCAAQSQMTNIDESAWSEHTCSGIKSWNDCKQAALKACPQGFYIRNELENITIQRRVFEAACKA